MATPNMFLIDPKHGIVTCKFHQYAVLPTKIIAHLSETHRGTTTPAQRLALQEEVLNADNGTPLRQSYADFVLPNSAVAPYPGLEILHNCEMCNYCGHILGGSSARHNMRKHIRNTHQDVPNLHTDASSVVSCQRFFKGVSNPQDYPGLTSYFPVLPPSNLPHTPETSPP